jgi:hypothetical protein
MRRSVPITLIAGSLFFLATGASSCDSNHVDANNSTKQDIDRTPAHILAMPDEFPNIATKCALNGPNAADRKGLHHKRVWVTSHTKDDVAPVITDDPVCP